MHDTVWFSALFLAVFLGAYLLLVPLLAKSLLAGLLMLVEQGHRGRKWSQPPSAGSGPS